MKLMRVFVTALSCAGLVACSGGSITGKVSVAGGQSSGIAVFAYGPSSGAAVTGSDGAFSVANLDDGDYVVRAEVKGTDEGEQSAAVTVKGGKAGGDVLLSFHFSAGTVTGHVTFADGSDATGLSVVAVGPETRTAVTEAGGAFTISNLKTGGYVLSVEAANTREGRVSIGVNATGTVDVGELRLTPVGHVTGTATYNNAPAVGVTVSIAGTGVSSVTDATGAFDLVNVPTGARTVYARYGDAPFMHSGTVDVTVVRGDNAPVALALTDDAPPTGIVRGVVTYYSPNDPTNITVSVDGLPGTTGSTPAAASGSYSLTVPVGTWDIVATAPSYPKQVLGQVVVHAGEVITLPGQRLSWYRKLWTVDGASVSANQIGGPSQTSIDGTSYQLLSVVSSGVNYIERLALLDVEAGDLRFLSVGGQYNNPIISRTGKYVAWSYADSVLLYTVATGQLVSIQRVNNGTGAFNFTSDENALFINMSDSMLRVMTAAPATPQRFPADGGALVVFPFIADHWMPISGSSGNFTMTQVASNYVRDLNAQQPGLSFPSSLYFGYSDGGSGTRAITIIPYDGGVPVLVAGTIDNGATPTPVGGTTSYPCFNVSGPGAQSFCVKMTDGSRIPLPDDSSAIYVNDTATRMAVVTSPSDAGASGFYETALPPTGALTPIDSSLNGWTVQWLSPTRVVALEGGTADARKLRLVNNGTVAPVDTDTADGGSEVYGPMVVTRQKSTGKWRAMLGDGPFRTIPVDQGIDQQATHYGIRVTTTPRTKVAALNFDPSNPRYFVIDETAATLTALPYGGTCDTGFRSGTYEFTSCTRDGVTTSSLPYDFNRKIFIENFDESVGWSNFTVGNEVRAGTVAISSDNRSLLLGTFGD